MEPMRLKTHRIALVTTPVTRASTRRRRTQRHAAARQPFAQLLGAVWQRGPAHSQHRVLCGPPALLGVLGEGVGHVKVQCERQPTPTPLLRVCGQCSGQPRMTAPCLGHHRCSAGPPLSGLQGKGSLLRWGLSPSLGRSEARACMGVIYTPCSLVMLLCLATACMHCCSISTSQYCAVPSGARLRVVKSRTDAALHDFLRWRVPVRRECPGAAYPSLSAFCR